VFAANMATITAVETILDPEHPILVWVLLHSDSGLIGFGETFQSSRAVAELIHETLAQLLLGQNPERIELLWHEMFKAVHYAGYAGTEMRAISAVDIALWDLLGKSVGQPLYTLLGGACRDSIPTYNTCLSCPPYNDHERFLREPGELARDLLREGICAMKIWPFDHLACNSLGQRISTSDLAAGVAPIAAIRHAVGNQMEIAIEGHCCWNLPSAIRIAQAVEPYRPMWLEELMVSDSPAATRQLRESTTIPIVTSERLMTRFGFKPLLAAGAADILMLDVAWTGGLTESRKIASLAATYQIPVAPHNPVGPISHFVAAHFSASVVNLFLMESVRAFYQTWFDTALTNSLRPNNGSFPLPAGTGLGTELCPEFLSRPNLIRRVSSLKEEIAGVLRIDRTTGRLQLE
jgi:L-alanine-DL-glutamate epimerase-like enolase superfamily enzyme